MLLLSSSLGVSIQGRPSLRLEVVGGDAAVHYHDRPRGPGRLVAGQIEPQVYDILGVAEAPQRDAVEPQAASLLAGPELTQQGGFNGTGADGVGTYAGFGILHGQRLGEGNQRALAHGVDI